MPSAFVVRGRGSVGYLWSHVPSEGKCVGIVLPSKSDIGPVTRKVPVRVSCCVAAHLYS